MNLEGVKKSLEARLDQLIGRISVIDSELRSPGSADSEERATESENLEVLEQLSVSERKEVEEIRAALVRIGAGTYSLCASCGTNISAARLEALPYTNVCVNCAA